MQLRKPTNRRCTTGADSRDKRLAAAQQTFSFSKMGNLFAKKTPKSRVTEQDKAVLQLKTQRDKLKQYQKKIQNNLEKERELAKTLLKDGKKDRALLLLKKKRAQETLLAKTVSIDTSWLGALYILFECLLRPSVTTARNSVRKSLQILLGPFSNTSFLL